MTGIQAGPHREHGARAHDTTATTQKNSTGKRNSIETLTVYCQLAVREKGRKCCICDHCYTVPNVL